MTLAKYKVNINHTNRVITSEGSQLYQSTNCFNFIFLICVINLQEAQGSLSSGMTKEEEGEISEFPQADGECEREINFWPLNDYENSQSIKDSSHINLDLSISSCFYC